MTNTLEQELVAAHKLGRDYAELINPSPRKARAKAENLYARLDLRDAFIAGYLGELKRMTAVRS